MAERVEIMVVAKDGASQIMRGITSSFGQLGNMVQGLTSGRGLEMLAEQFIQFGKESVNATVNYANEVRSLMLVSGESAETTSQFLQVLDDYKISAQDALTATRAMTKEGLVPNLETLASLSDEYLSITDKQKQNEFVIKNLGRAGLQWTEILNKGSAAILEQGDAIDKNLILTQEAVDSARQYELALDDWNDAVLGLKVSIGNELIPALTNLLKNQDDVARAHELAAEQGINLASASREVKGEYLKLAIEERRAALSADDMTDSQIALGKEVEKTAEEIKAEEDAIKELTKANQDQLSTLANLTGVINDYQDKEASLKQEHDELLAKKNELISQGWWAESDAVLEVNQKLAENEAAQQANTDAFVLATNTRILSRAEELLSIDGLTTAEKDALIERGIAMGVYTQEAAARMHEEENAANSLAAAINNIPVSKSITISTAYTYTGTPPGLMTGAGGAGTVRGPHSGRAGGGGVSAGELYRVNETRTEYFRPSMSGDVIPIGRGGNGGGGSVVIQYSPMISLADESEVQNRLLPAIIKGVQVARSNGQI
jgi:hypothetical protein